MNQVIAYEKKNGLGILTINRPHARNALNWAAQEAFAEVIDSADSDKELRVFIVTGAGDKAFVSGGDVKELVNYRTREDGRRLNKIMGSALIKLSKLPVPVIAAINGDAIGGGCEILTACDLSIAVPHARFQFAQIQVGLTTGWGGGARIINMIGRRRASELLLTGRTINALKAREIGLVNKVLDDGVAVIDEAIAWAEEVAFLPKKTLAAMKAILCASDGQSLSDQYKLEASLFMDLWPGGDHIEAMNAFVEKRRPNFNKGID